MHGHLFLALALVTVGTSCRREPKPPADRPDHALLRDLEPPPLNTPVKRPPGQQQQDAQVQLPPGPASALIAARRGRPFAGTATLNGRVTISADRIRIEPQAGDTVELLYRLPPGLPSLPAGAGNGSIQITERSGPGGADRRVIVSRDARLLLAEIWQRSPQPLVVDLGNGLRLVQQPARAASDQPYADAPLRAVDRAGAGVAVPIGRATEIQTAAGRYIVLAEISSLFTPSPSDAGQVEGGYILRAWVVPAGR